MSLSEEVVVQIESYLSGSLSTDSLSEWLLSSVPYFAAQPKHRYEVALWARACNLVSLLRDGVMDEGQVRAELGRFLEYRPKVRLVKSPSQPQSSAVSVRQRLAAALGASTGNVVVHWKVLGWSEHAGRSAQGAP